MPPTLPSSIDNLPALTVVITCMGRLEHLRQSLPLLAAQEDATCILVDYGCPDNAGDWTARHHPEVLVLRSGPVPCFSATRARNLGAAAVRTPWVCFMDADTLPDPAFLRRLRTVLAPGRFFRPEPCPPDLSGLVACRLQDFHAAGGYDEIFEGWGSEDRDLYLRLQRAGIEASTFAAEGLRFIPHDDHSRTRHHPVRDRFLSLRINGMYLQIKHDLAALIGKVDLDARDREALYARIRERILAQPGQAARMDIDLPSATRFTQPPGWGLRRRLSYRFEPLPSSHGQ